MIIGDMTLLQCTKCISASSFLIYFYKIYIYIPVSLQKVYFIYKILYLPVTVIITSHLFLIVWSYLNDIYREWNLRKKLQLISHFIILYYYIVTLSALGEEKRKGDYQRDGSVKPCFLLGIKELKSNYVINNIVPSWDFPYLTD